MIYLLIFYWIFAALFCFGAIYRITKSKGINTFGVFSGCLILGGILFPMYLGSSLNFDQYE